MNEQQFRGTRRFELRRPLGFGGMGVVYQAYDRERDLDVALKVLIGVGPEAIRSLKREFRSLADISHPNLIGFFDLIHDEQTWFITMELVDGRDLIAYMRGERGSSFRLAPHALALAGDITRPATNLATRGIQHPPVEGAAPVDAELLLKLFLQVARAVSAVHAAGHLHCDIKPSNVLVSREGRVVLLDFGLAAELTPRATPAAAASPMAGTPFYVAPEQWRGEETTTASDWYSVGVMLFEALTGRIPFVGDTDEIQQAKEQPTPDLTLLERSGAPSVLQELCRRLLAPRPSDRPTGVEVQAALADPGIQVEAAPPSNLDAALFVGRSRERELLRRAHRRSAAGQPIAVKVEGPSGIGKTALMRTFLAEIKQTESAVVLEGRCYERESIPFKALDTVIDAIAAHLAEAGLPDASIPPENVSALVRIFPVLREVRGLAVPDKNDGEGPEPIQLRQRAASALRGILAGIGRGRSVVVCIDDAQWGDTDSAQLLASLLEPPGAPPLLLLLARRSDLAPGAFLTGLHSGRSRAMPEIEMQLTPLSDRESVDLAESLLLSPGAAATAKDIAREAKGNPYFLTELTRFCLERFGPSQPGAILAVTLEEVLRRRLSVLPRAARRLLEVIAVAGKPISKRLAEVTAGLEVAEATSIGVLRSTRFIRTSGPRESDVVETFHDRVRETLVAGLDPEVRRQLHRHLAEVAEAEMQGSQALGGPPAAQESDFLAEHFRAAQIPDKALRYTLAAARRARSLYALHDSVRHWENVVAILEEGPPVDPADERHLRREQADALRNAGLFDRAVEALQVCAGRTTKAADRAEVGIDMGRVFQEMGRPADAMRELEKALSLLGRPVPTTKPRLLGATLVALTAHGLGLSAPGSRAAKRPAHETVRRQVMTALLWLNRIYYFADRRKMAWAILTAARLARSFDDQVNLVRTECYYLIAVASMGALTRAVRASNKAALRMASSEDRLAQTLTNAHVSSLAFFSNDLNRARPLLRQTVEGLEQMGEYWDLQIWLHQEAMAALMSADFRGAAQLWERLRDRARAVKSIPHQGWSQAWLPYTQYSMGAIDADAALAELERAHEFALTADDVATLSSARMHAAIISVREEKPAEAADYALRTFDYIWGYHVLVPVLQQALVHAAEAALYALEQGVTDGRRRTALERIARRGYRRALRLGRTFKYLKGPALRVKARYKALTQGPEAAEPIFRHAISTLSATPNRWDLLVALHDAAAAVPRLRGALLPGARRLAEDLGATVELARLVKL